MKLNTLLAGLFSVALLFSGCSKDDDSDNKPAPVAQEPVTTQGMSAKINGTAWTAVMPMATTQSGGFSVGGSNAAGHAIAITIQNAVTQPGTYSGMGLYTEMKQDSTAGPMYIAPAATLVISKLDLAAKKASGTFTFSAMGMPGTGATGTKSVTEGVFNDVTIQ